jgi:hypothetical protein
LGLFVVQFGGFLRVRSILVDPQIAGAIPNDFKGRNPSCMLVDFAAVDQVLHLFATIVANVQVIESLDVGWAVEVIGVVIFHELLVHGIFDFFVAEWTGNHEKRIYILIFS